MTVDEIVRTVAALPPASKMQLALDLLNGSPKARRLGDAVLGLAYYQRRALNELAAAMPGDRQGLVDLQRRIEALSPPATQEPPLPAPGGLGTDDPYRDSPGRRGGRSCGD